MAKTNPAKKTSREDWHPADVVAALHKRGVSIRDIAKAHGLTHAAIAAALRQRVAPSERRIADALGLHPMEIWPSRYREDGAPMPKGQCNAAGRGVNGNLKQEA